MAGLGFELRKVYNKGSFLAKQKAYGYAGIIYVGPMILGILLILAVVYLSVFGRFGNSERDHLLGLISYSILASLAITNIFSMVVTRYVLLFFWCHDVGDWLCVLRLVLILIRHSLAGDCFKLATV